MKHYIKTFFFLFIFSFLSLNLSAQYGPQFDNRGFEQWTTRVSEPVHWHSGGTATGTFAGFLSSQIETSTQTRPGSTGSKSARIFPETTWGVLANGNITNGRMNAGSMTATGSGNYNYTQRAENLFNTPISQLPDSLSIWVCFRCTSGSEQAQVKAVVHGDADYKFIANGTEEPANMHVATAVESFTRTSSASGAYNWRRLSIPFNNSGPCTDVRYILMTATTNAVPGSGSSSDDLFIDDVLLIYRPSLTLGQLASNSFAPGDNITIPFTLTGTMSPDNLNATANVVIAQLSDANGSFSNPTELGRITTNTSGSITTQIPNVANGQHYHIRVISTNYPMIGQNIQEVSISNPSYIITVTPNPSEGGTVSGSGNYNQGETCTLTATANTGYTFVKWTKDGTPVSTNPIYTFTVTASETYVAHFQVQTYSITATASPSEGGTVSGNGNYNHGASCTLTATANTGYTFVKWTKNGAQVSTNASYTFTVTESAAYVAHFQLQSYTITATAAPTGSGTIIGAGTYNHGASCTLTATPANGYTFMNWTENGNVVSTNANYVFIVERNRTLVANFTLNSYTITATADPVEGGTIIGAGDYEHGASCTLNAIANEDYTFVEWTKDGVQVSTDARYTFTVTASETYEAHFELQTYMEESMNATQILPNPFSTKVSIRAEKPVKRISIYDIYGRLLKVQETSDTTIDLDMSDLTDGIYLLHVNYGDSTSIHNILKVSK